MQNNRTRKLSQRVCYTLIAGMAGAFLIPQVAFAAPTGEHDYTTGVNVDRNTANTTKITSAATNNVINWRDYSVNQGETVQYDGGVTTGAAAHNYLNIVTGANTSNINGKIEGGDHVYIVNPNGVIFGKNAEVNVGHLHVSTQNGVAVATKTAFETGGTSPLDNTAALKSDVVNMGKITANTVEVHGKNIRFLNAADVTTDGTALAPVTIYTASVASTVDKVDRGYAHIGYEGSTAPSNFTRGNTTSANPEYYKLVSNKTDLKNINTTNLAGNYMLAQDIDLGGAEHTPIGGNAYGAFTGKFDGNFFRVKNFTVSGVNSAGLFGEVSGGRIENVGVSQATITGKRDNSHCYAGGIAGHTSGTSILKNVYATETTTLEGRRGLYGGIVGSTGSASSSGSDHTVIDSAYSKAVLGRDNPGTTAQFTGGGIVGHSGKETDISNSYSAATNTDGTAAYFLYIADPDDQTIVKNSYGVVGTEFSSNETSFSSTTAINTYKINGTNAEKIGTAGSKVANTSSTYTGWDINNDGAPGAKWRIYEGRTLPLLTAFMGVSSETTYNYRYFDGAKQPSADKGNTAKSNGGADITAEYNSYYLKIVNGSNSPGGKANAQFGAGADTSKVIDYVGTDQDFDRTNGIRNVGTKAILWSDQDGPNLRGVNVTITPRDVRLDGGKINPKRMYNGKSDVTKAFIDALTSGDVSSSGFTQEDIKAGTVALDFGTGHFKAQMADKNVGTDKTVTFSGTIGFTGTDKDNYTFDGSSLSTLQGKATITKAPLYLAIAKKRADDKIYDGTSSVTDSAMLQSGSPPNITLDKSKTGLTLAQINAGTPAMPDGAIMTGDNDTTKDNVDITSVGGPKYTNAAGTEQFHAGDHKLQYTGVGLTGTDAGNYELFYTPENGTKTEITDGKVYLDGKIIPRQILRDSFNIYDKRTHAQKTVQRVYNGNDEYTPGSDVYLSSNASASGNTGIVDRDRNHITFALTGTGHFTQADGTTRTKNVSNAAKVAYTVTGQTDDDNLYKLSDYYVLDTDNVTKKALSDTFNATGAGKITPKVLTATVQNNHIEKTYDAKQNHTDGNRNDITGKALVKLEGFVGRESRANTSTANYASQNVDWDTATRTEKAQAVTYTASFDRGTGAESDNYTLDATGTTVLSSQTVAGSYTGTIKQRDLGLTFGNVTKIYDGTTTNATKTVTGLNDGLSGAVTGADGTTVVSLSGLSNVMSQYADRHAGTNKRVEYNGLSDVLGSNHNYKIADKQYGTGTITRRLIESSGFQVRKKDGTIANATKVYDGTDKFTLEDGTYLVAKTAASATTPNTGVVDVDKDNIYFTMTGNEGHFLKGDTGTDRTSHVSEAERVGYSIAAGTKDGGGSPLSNYYFGEAYTPEDQRRNLEDVKGTDPRDAVTATGSITPASIRATTKEISKVYDGMREHTDGNRTEVKGNTVVSFTGWVSGQTRDNTSTALYADRKVSRDSSGNVIKKSVTYTAQLTGQYADDYQIVNQSNAVISTPPTGSGAAKTVTANLGTVANAGTITPRKLNVTMRDVSKTYDGTAGNNSATVTGFTDDPASSVLADVLGVDNVTASRLTTKYQGMMSASPATATSTYGRGTTSFTANANASNGTQHDVQYTNMRNAFKDEFGATTAGNYIVDDIVYGKGTINRREITPNNFQVKDANGNVANATKVYDGTTKYTLEDGWHLTPAAGLGTGVIPADYGKVVFRLNGDAQFADSSDNPTANVASATKVLYNVKAEGDVEKIKNYTLNGVNLESGTGKVSGGGSITRRVLELDLVQNSGIDKVYDGETTLYNTSTNHWNALKDTDSAGNVMYVDGTTAADKLVTTDGTSFNITSNYMESGSVDKNVKRSSGNIVDKDILYKVAINGNATNYSFKKGGTVTDAESGLELSATGKITPKDLSGAFKKITKEYDGTTSVDPTKVEFKTGTDGVLSGDTVNLATHTESFRSENVNGDNTTQVIDGTPQKNWINYSNLSLGGAQAGNYTIASTAKGLGEITPYVLNPTSVDFSIGLASKTYDGTTSVKWTDGSSAPSDQKKYITSATVNINGNHVDVLKDLEVSSAEYDTKDVDNGRSANRVTYNLSYTGQSGNFSLGGASTFAKTGNGVITKKDVTVTVKSPLTKTYDATTGVLGVAKNSANAVINTANDIIGMTGLVSGDGATNASTATYADQNAGTGKVVNYDVKLDSANAGNYNLKYNGAITSSISTNNNTITKRKVDVTFAPVTKSYDGTPTNTSITPSVSAADAAVLQRDSSAHVSGTNLTGLTGITSQYGTGTTDGTFTPDANAGDKTVRYQGVGTAMGTVFGTNNYDFNIKDGTGRINKAKINAGNVVFDADDAHKTYDGTPTVKYGGSSANSEVRKYINRIGVTLNGNWINLQNDVTMDSAEYSDVNATNGTKHRVTYKFHLNNSNIDISGDNTFSKDKEGIIDRRVLNLDLAQKSPINKIYDATPDVHNTNTRHYNAFVEHDALGNVTYAASTTAENKLVRKDGNPETTVKVAAKYADENAGAKNVNYTAQIEGDAGKNYTLKYGTTEGDADTGINFAATGTIAKRKLTLGFDKASKQYDTLADNPDQKKLLSAIADNSDARGVDTLKQDGILAADGTVNTGAFDTTHVASEYGIRSNDPANPFTPDPNVGTKDVRYTNVKSALSGTKAGNYDIEDTVYGTGEITRAKIKAADFDFQIDPSKKTYDGTTTVYWKDKEGQWQEAKGEEGLDGAKKYYFGDRSTVKLANGQRVKVNPADFSLTEAAYQNKNVAGGTETWTDADGNTHRNWVNYKLHINTTNFDVEGERDTTRKGVGTISKRNLATMLPKHLIKEYDGQQTFDETNRDYVNALANENITHIVKADQSKVQLKVKGEYDDPNASAETKVDAQKGIHLPAAPNGRKVKYTLTLSGDADTLANYTLDGHDTTYTVPGKPADIYKKTLTVTVKNIDKVYDGTSTVVRDAGGGILVPHPEAGKLKFDPDDFVRGEEFSFDQTAADKIDGDYSDPNVNPNGDGTKSITCRNLSQAFADNATRGTAARYAKNYRVEDTAQGRGKITPRKVSAADFALSFSNAVKTYDNRDTVKPNKGMRSLNDLLNDNATVKIGTGAVPVAKKEFDVLSGTYGGTDAGTYDNVTYTLRYTGHNLNVTDALTKDKQKGEIIKRAVTVDVLGSLWKYYDGTENLYQTGDRSIKTYRGSMEVKEGDDIVYMSRANGADDETGLLSDDGSTNASTAHFVGKDAGDDKNVAYTFAIGGANAKNYQLVNIYNEPQTAADTKGGNTIRKRPLDIVFKDVRKEYDTTDVNRSATPYVNDADATVLQRDGAGVRPILDSADQQKYKDRKELRLIDRRSGKELSVASAYEPSMDAPHIPAANAGDKSVRYSGVGSALRSILGTDADKNYDLSPLDENLYGNGRIDKARISASDFRLKFTPANKEYDGGYTISDARSYLHPDSKMRLPHTPVPPDQEWTKYRLTDTDVERMTGTYRAVGGKRPQDVGRKPVDYEVKLKDDNFIFGEWKGTDFTEGKWDGVIRASEWGDITPREIFEDSRSPLTKVYDGTRNIANVGDDLLTFRHKSGERPFIKNDEVRNSSMATYDNANVAWKNNVWNQGEGTVGDVNVTYRLKLTGRDAENYKIVSAPGRTVKDSVDQDGTRTQTTDGTGKITPRDIHLKADPQTRWINEGLPKSYTGKPMGSNLGRKDVPELAPGEVLPGQIEYSSPNARLRWGDYAINGIYRAPKAGTRYQLPDGTWTTQSFAGGDGDAVSRNYRFVQDPANKSAFHMGPYIPDYEYYKALTQTSKMTPDEYAYENASLDRRSNFGRDAEAEIDYMPPSVNTIKDGVDITQTGIHVTDETVFSLVNEVFGER